MKLFSGLILSTFIFLTSNFHKSVGKNTEWWKFTMIYEIFIWSFKDSNGDGVGDFNGITSMLEHFVELGIETLWITPYFKSPMRDMGYDVANFTDVDPRFGNLDDFDSLVKEAKKRGLKIMVDFVINHSSDQHPWFLKSIDRIEPYTDFYVWKDAKGIDANGNPIPPNNWISVFLGSAWKWNEKRKQFYLHQFADRQPDFNLRNKNLKAELKKIIKFWFERGAHAARLDAAKHFIEDAQFRDEPYVKGHEDTTQHLYYEYEHIYTTDLWETYEFIHEMREYIDNLKFEDRIERILVVESYTDLNHTMMYYGSKDYPIVHFPFNFDLVGVDIFPNAEKFDSIIKHWLNNMPPGSVANWVAENHDNYRVANRLNDEYADIIMITMMTLPGVACLYYGQEIGMKDNNVRPDQIKDVYVDGTRPSRDPERLPMQWDDSINAGFTSKLKPWLPVNPNYWKVNVRQQKKEANSRFNMFKTLSKIRQTKTAKYGKFISYILSPFVYAFTRSLKGEPTYLILFNLGTETEMVHFHNVIFNLSSTLKVLTASLNSGYRKGNLIFTTPTFPRSFIMRPMSAVVFTTK